MDPCAYCTEKHIAKARVYVMEAIAGYPARIGMAIGELAAAEEEAPDTGIRAHIRHARKRLEVTRVDTIIDWEFLLGLAEHAIGEGASERKTAPGDTAPLPPREPCKGCEKKAEREKAQLRAMATPAPVTTDPQRPRERIPALPRSTTTTTPPPHRGKLILLTCLRSFEPSYSLATVILDQARAGVVAGFEVIVVGMQHMVHARPRIPGVRFEPLIPDVGWQEDVISDIKVQTLLEAIKPWLAQQGPAVVISHDLVFQSWYVTMAKALHTIGDSLPGVRWFHQVHSSVGAPPSGPAARWRARVPKGHRMAAVNWSDLPTLQVYYQSRPEDWVTLPNTCDPAEFLGWSSEVTGLYRRLEVARRTVVQVYPLSTPRAEAKGLHSVIRAMGELKRRGHAVLLIVANAHANGGDGKAAMERMDELAAASGLQFNDMVWTSRQFPKTLAEGMSREDVRSLFQMANVFMFPSSSEACGLVMLEAATAGNALILNRSLPVLTDYVPHQMAEWVTWGSIREPRVDHDAAMRQAADAVEQVLESNQLQSRARIRRSFGLEALAATLGRVLDMTLAQDVGAATEA